jgi:hypothetical protein
VPSLVILTVGLAGCFASNLAKFEQDLASRSDAVSSYEELVFFELELDKSKKLQIASPLTVIQTEFGDAFVLPISVPAGAKSFYIRSILSTDIASTSHVVYPTVFFSDSDLSELDRIEPKMEAVYAGFVDSMYFEQTIDLPVRTSKVVAVFSPKHFGQYLVYDATMHYGAMVGAVPVTGSKKGDYDIPIGPGGPFRIEFQRD